MITPLILGILTREIIEKKHGIKKFIELKPYFSTITLTGLYILLYLIFASKAKLVIAQYGYIITITHSYIILWNNNLHAHNT
ncbi:hypothetical protein [Staphylothermus marinus]|uniref:hypothetical protein n=1 Tax=Staphylothermus marinus TaxID=2280 RepID=UPI003CC7657A